MKKSVIISIGIIYALSIFLVTFFGLKHQTFNEVIYVSQVEIIEEKATYLSDGSKFLLLTDSQDGVYKYQLKWYVSPENVTNGKVVFIYDKQKSNVVVDENGLVTITSLGYPDTVTVEVRSTDGTRLSDSIKLMILN